MEFYQSNRKINNTGTICQVCFSECLCVIIQLYQVFTTSLWSLSKHEIGHRQLKVGTTENTSLQSEQSVEKDHYVICIRQMETKTSHNYVLEEGKKLYKHKHSHFPASQALCLLSSDIYGHSILLKAISGLSRRVLPCFLTIAAQESDSLSFPSKARYLSCSSTPGCSSLSLKLDKASFLRPLIYL